MQENVTDLWSLLPLDTSIVLLNWVECEKINYILSLTLLIVNH